MSFRSGKARYLGASSMHAWQFMKALGLQRANGWAPFISMQNYYNLLYREDEREMLRLCESEGIGGHAVVAAGARQADATMDGRAADRAGQDGRVRHDALREDNRDRQAGDRADARDREGTGVPAAQVAMAWLLHKPAVTSPIFGATKMQHLDDAVAAVSLKLSAEEIDEARRAVSAPPRHRGLLVDDWAKGQGLRPRARQERWPQEHWRDGHAP